jgi:Mrp family chromosome partitioning ATPase
MNEGVTNYLINDLRVEEVIQRTFTKNLDILLSGPIPPNPDELIESEKTLKLFAELRRKYEFIVMDTPSIGLVGDAYLLDRHSDVTLFVVRQNHTTKKNFATSIAEAVANRMKGLKIVFTDVKQKVKIQDINFTAPVAENHNIILRYLARWRKAFINMFRKF